ncbi:MAG: Holliday junction branch migration protein RuvA [Kofleriaceae bacterium]
MIARLEGILVREGDQVIVDCRGVGYEVTCSAYTIAALPANGEPVTLRVYTQMRETAIALYGFADLAERALFDLLITVKNVGPSTAIAILSGAGPRDIGALIARQDVPGLTRIKGIGKKTAELLVVELHEKCEMLLLSWTAEGNLRSSAIPAGARAKVSGGGMRHPMLEEVIAALVGMGWRSIEAESAVKDLDVTQAGVTIEMLLVQALRSMPR